jgi:hypothetical protein
MTGGAGPLVEVVTWTILLSVLAHGLSAGWLARHTVNGWLDLRAPLSSLTYPTIKAVAGTS